MPRSSARSSAFRKATKAFKRTRNFFSYESPYPTVVPAAAAPCCGPCCAVTGPGIGPGVAKPVTCPCAAFTSTSESPTAAAAAAQAADTSIPDTLAHDGLDPTEPEILLPLPGKTSGEDESESEEPEEIESDESESSEEDHDNHYIPYLADENTTTDDFCECKTCVAARYDGVHRNQKRGSKDAAAHTEAKNAEDEHCRAAAVKVPGQAAEMRRKAQKKSGMDADELGNEDLEIAASLEEFQERILAEKDLRGVVRWGCEKIVKVTDVSLGERALKQLIATLTASAEAGRKERLKKEDAEAKIKEGEKRIVQASTTAEKTAPQRFSEPMIESLTVNAKAGVAKKSKAEMMMGLQQQMEMIANQRHPSKGAHAEHEQKILNTIKRGPMNDDQYEEVSSRSLYFDGILPNFSEGDVVQKCFASMVKWRGPRSNCILETMSPVGKASSRWSRPKQLMPLGKTCMAT